VDAVPVDHRLVEGQARLGTIPADKLIDGMFDIRVGIQETAGCSGQLPWLDPDREVPAWFLDKLSFFGRFDDFLLIGQPPPA
jgi:hypothetical protein